MTNYRLVPFEKGLHVSAEGFGTFLHRNSSISTFKEWGPGIDDDESSIVVSFKTAHSDEDELFHVAELEVDSHGSFERVESDWDIIGYLVDVGAFTTKEEPNS